MESRRARVDGLFLARPVWACTRIKEAGGGRWGRRGGKVGGLPRSSCCIARGSPSSTPPEGKAKRRLACAPVSTALLAIASVDGHKRDAGAKRPEPFAPGPLSLGGPPAPV
eukprot:scaffold20072_cov88-Isochrysis_galbana.AAC.2